ncbi:MAG: hypothetical protein HZA93_10710 [Verrucomicrobia bacterium]|nr:hypothetical protein [Verrucomicrobiota bacterium]
MIVNVPQLVLAILLLWFPRKWLRLGSVLFKRRARRDSSNARTVVEPWDVHEPGDPRVNFRTEIGKFRNFVDLLRAAAGAVCIVGGLKVESCVQLAEGAAAAQERGLLAVKGAILVAGLLVQTIRYERSRLTFYPPIFFLAGMSVPLCEPAAAVFAFVAIWAINPLFSNARGFLAVYAVLMAVFGQYFAGLGDKTAMFAGLLGFMPVLLSLLANRPLIIMARKAQPRGPGSPT